MNMKIVDGCKSKATLASWRGAGGRGRIRQCHRLFRMDRLFSLESLAHSVWNKMNTYKRDKC